MHDRKIGSIFPGKRLTEPIQREIVNNGDDGALTGFRERSLLFESNSMRSNVVHSGASARRTLAGLHSQNGGKPPMLRAIHAAAADVEKGLKFWKKIVEKSPSHHRFSREFVNRQG